MRPQAFVGVLLLFILCPWTGHSQPKGVSISKKSPWVESIDYDSKAKPEDGQGASVYYLLLDVQENTATQESYEHYAYTILTSEGIQNMSDLSFEFEPTYQQLILHEIKIIRSGTVIDQLSKDIQVIQREQSLEYNLYDGTKTAIINLKDIRVGDIVEYSLTRKGYNPVFKGHINRTYAFDDYYSHDKSITRIILPSTHKVNLRNYGKGIPQPIVTESKGMTDYRWVRSKIEAKEFEYGLPAWYNNSSIVTLSDFESWQNVGEWARELFIVSPAERDKLKTLIASTFKSTDDKEYILEAIRFVQDEVRYLGFETGINTHKPYPPSQIFTQRFGDCKDKSLLLTTLLQVRNIEAYPVLVNTSLKQSLDERIPSGMIFDHCITEIVFKGEKIFIDPTIGNQGGDLGTCYLPDYRRGLVIDNEIDAPDVLPSPEPPTTTEVHDIEALTMGGEAMLSVRITFTGSDADYQRSYFSQAPLEKIQKSYLEYYANLYPDIQRWEDMKFTDDRKGNTFSIEEKYKIPTFWKPLPDNENQLQASLQPLSIASYVDVPKNIQQRTLPYALSFPVNYYHTIHITLPQEFAVTPVDNVIETPYYQYKSEIKKDGNEITKLTHYKTKQDHIPADQIQKYVKDHTAMLNELVLLLTYNALMVEASSNVLPGVLTTIVSLIGGALLCFYLYRRYDPSPARYMIRGQPINGWLILLGLGLILGPIRLVVDVVQYPALLTGENWMSYLATKNYGLFSFVFFSQIFNVMKLLFSGLLIALFFERRSSFPRLMSILLAINLVVICTDTFLGRMLADDPATVPLTDAIQSLVGAAIWIPYLNISQRVKETFVIRGPGFGNDQNDGELTPEETSVFSKVEQQ
jgi:transglutaminase-like putative cysteine protease